MDFSDGNDADSGMELTKLRPRGAANYQSQHHHQPLDDVVFLERDILPNDTLQSFSVLYSCTINDLKRANNLITEQDFFALKRLKIPVKKFGLLTDTEEERKRRSRLTTSDIGSVNVEESNNGGAGSLGDTLSDTDPLLSPSDDDTSRFLKTMDKQIRKSAKEVMSGHQVLEEVVTSLGSVGYRPLASPGMRRQAHDECNGSDWGCKWWALLLTSLLVLMFFVFIIAYEFYWRKKLLEMHEDHQHSHPMDHLEREGFSSRCRH